MNKKVSEYMNKKVSEWLNESVSREQKKKKKRT